MTGGRSKPLTTTGGADFSGGFTGSEKAVSPSTPSADGMLMAVPSVAPGVDLYAQARKALTERCPFDSEEAVPRFGTLPASLAVNLNRKSDGRRKHRKIHEVTESKPVCPGRPPPVFTVWEKTEEFFRPLTLDDIDLLVPQLPPDSCFYLPDTEKLLEEVMKGESVLCDSAPCEMASSSTIKPELVNVEVEVAQPMQIDEVGCSTALSVEEPDTKDLKSLNWLLGCKKRFLLTPGRPSREKKLTGKDAGLEQLLRLTLREAAETARPICDVCCSGDADIKYNHLLFCDSCKVSVHQKCYGVHEMPAGGWLCSWCKHQETSRRKAHHNADDMDCSSRPCLLCPKVQGALKPVMGNLEGGGEKRFVHLFCSLWTPGVYVGDVEAMEPVLNVKDLQEPLRKFVCNLCKVKHGVCLRCSHGSCRTFFHPNCAREAKHQMEIWGKFGHDNAELRIFCLKHSLVFNTDTIASALPNTVSNTEVVPKDLSSRVPIKRLPKIKIKCKDNNIARGGLANSLFVEAIKNDANPVKQTLALELGTETEHAQSNKSQGVLDNGNVLRSTSDVITILRKIIDRRKISIDDVALELGVSSASLESSMLGGVSLPSKLRLKIIQWLQNFVHVQPSACFLKSRNNGNLISGVSDPSASSLNGRIGDTGVLAVVTDTPIVKEQLVCSRNNNKHDIRDGNLLLAPGDIFNQDDSDQMIVDEDGASSNCMSEMATYTNHSVAGNIEDCHLTELDVAVTSLENSTGLLDSINSGDSRDQDKCGCDLKGVSDCSLLEKKQYFDTDITELKTQIFDCSDHGACLADNLNNLDIRFRSRSYIHPFILKKLNELQIQWNFLQKQGNVEASYNDKSIPMDSKNVECCLSTVTRLDQMDDSPTDEVEGELLYLQNCLLDKATSIKRSCEELICKIINHLPQEVDAFRSKIWDTVLSNQYLCEVKEAKKRGRKERRHSEAQAILAAATAAAATSRTSVLRKDVVDEIRSAPQDPLKNSTATRRVKVHFQPGPRPKETISKVSSDKHFGDFSFPDFTKENALVCDVCWRTETIVNRIFVCSSCKVAVHLDCYRRLKDPTGPWLCELCEDSSFLATSPRNQQISTSVKFYSRILCTLCGGASGAFRKSTDGEWVHAFCAEWLLESAYKRGQQNLVSGMDSILKEKDINICCICHNKFGVCLKCSYGHCQSKFHPSCAKNAGLFLNIKSINGKLQHKAYCEKHSVEQREKADNQHGAEELKSIKQVRVDLEKLRLLCERIIRREKLKRELVVCSHGILASRRDCVAFSAMFRSSFASGVSSESATTSIDNPSFSGAIQRSDGIAFDSINHGRHYTGLQMNVDGKTDAMIQLSNKRKIANRISFAGKQLPQRPIAHISSTADGGEVKCKDRKGMKSLEKEKVMTSYQASLQNQRLPKGFVYVPVDSLQKEDPSAVAHDSGSCEHEEPGG